MGKQTPPSIKTLLIQYLTVPFFIFAIVLFIYLYLNLETKITNFFDNRLLASAKSIEENIGIKNSKLFVDLENFSIDLLSNNNNGSVYYSVIDDENNLLVGHRYLFNKRVLGNKDVLYYDNTYDGEKLRVISYKTTLPSANKIYTAYITLGETTQERDYSMHEVLKLSLVVMVIIFIVSLLISLIAISKGLQPLRKLQKLIKKRDDRDLQPLIFETPKELEEITNSVNLLLERSRKSIEHIEQFNSDISHQLRTPLAEMQMKLELHFKDNKKEFQDFHALISNMTHITEQLLLYAKTNPNAIDLKHFKKENINDICKEYCLKTGPRVYTKGFEFAFEKLNEDVMIECDKTLIESMLDNLINNALCYAIDEQGKPKGTITLSIERHNNTVWLNVKDEGPGVDKLNLKTIFKRYHRIDSSKKGTGLGLSIVKQIATLHQANVIAQNENGLKISVIFKINSQN